jgi:hypothetical protein
MTFISGHDVIPPGPFLDELKANGLVTCEGHQKYNQAIARTFSPPQHVWGYPRVNAADGATSP